MGDCITPAQVSDIAQKDTQRLVGAIAKTLAANAPFMNVIGGGVFPSGVSDEIRTSVQLQAAPGDSLALPEFVCDTDLCGTRGHQDLTDAINFISRLESKRGFGPRVCGFLEEARDAVYQLRHSRAALPAFGLEVHCRRRLRFQLALHGWC